MRNTIFQPRQTLITAEWLNAVDSAVFDTASTVTPQAFGAVGDGVTDDFVSLQATITSLKKPGLDLSTSASAKAALRGLPKKIVDLGGKTYCVSSSLNFADLYNVTFTNGVIKAITGAWGTSPVLYVAKPQATDIYHDQRIRFVTFNNITVDGNGLANGIYLENTFCVTFQNFYCLGWPDSGTGLWTSDSTTTPNVSNTNLRITNSVFFQKDAAEITSGSITSAGTGLNIKSADFFIDGLVVAYANVCLSFDNLYNGQVSNFHPYCKTTQKCLYVGPNAHHIAFTNLYTDTGVVELRSFDHTFNGAHFIASSQVNLIATVAGESADGLEMHGLFANTPAYLTEGVGTWATNFRGRVYGCLTTGGPVPSPGSVIVGRQSASRASISFSDPTTLEYNTGLFSPATSMMGYTLSGTEQWRFDDSGRWLYGYTANLPTGQSASPKVQINGTTLSDTSFSLTRWSTTASAQPQIVLARSHSATVGTYSAVQSGDSLGRLAWCGDTGASLNPVGAALIATAAATWTTSSAPTTLGFQTTPSSSTTPTTWWTISPGGTLSPSGTNSIIFPGPYASDAAAGSAGVSVTQAYRHTDGTVHWRVS